MNRRHFLTHSSKLATTLALTGWLLPATEPYRTSKTVGLRLAELKRKKLQLKDEITKIRSSDRVIH